MTIECGLWIVDCGLRIADWGMRNAEWLAPGRPVVLSVQTVFSGL